MKKRKTNEQFIKDVKRLWGNEYTPIGEYKGSAIKIEVRHNLCGNTWWVLPGNLLAKKGCPYCKRMNLFITDDEFKKRVSALTGDNIIVLTKYTNGTTPIVFECKKHGTKFSMQPTSFLHHCNYWCPDCKYEHTHKVQSKSQEQFEKDLIKKHHGDIVSIGTYVNTHTKVKLKCTKCNNTFMAEPNAVIRLSGCPFCYESHGEKDIAYTLDRLNISYVAQKKFENCFLKRKLPFDFYIEDENLLIEYDGAQHIKPVEMFGGEKYLDSTKIRDDIKNKFAIDEGIHLFRISYKLKDEELCNAVEDYMINKIDNKLFNHIN